MSRYWGFLCRTHIFGELWQSDPANKIKLSQGCCEEVQAILDKNTLQTGGGGRVIAKMKCCYHLEENESDLYFILWLNKSAYLPESTYYGVIVWAEFIKCVASADNVHHLVNAAFWNDRQNNRVDFRFIVWK